VFQPLFPALNTHVPAPKNKRSKKIYVGGLSLRTMEYLNMTLDSPCKLVLEHDDQSSLLWVDALKAKYLKNDAFLKVPVNLGLLGFAKEL
jgi:hypothetical protein